MFILNVSLIFPVFICIHLSSGIQFFAEDNPSTVGIMSVPENNDSPLNLMPPSDTLTSAFPSLEVNQLGIFPSDKPEVLKGVGTPTFLSPAVNPSQIPPDVNGKSTPATGTFASPIPEPNLTVPDIVKSFALPFIERVRSDQKLYDAFVGLQSLNAEELKNILYDIVFNEHLNVDGDNPTSSARLVSESLASNYEHVTADSMIGFYAYTLGKYMFYHGLLTPGTFQDLSEKFVNEIRDNVYSVVDFSREAAFRAIFKGFMEYLTDFGLYRKDNAESFATYIAIEFQNLRKYRTDV